MPDARTGPPLRSMGAVDPSVPADRLKLLLVEFLERVGRVEDALEFVVSRMSRLTREERALLGRLLPVLWRATAGAASETDKALEPVAAVDRAEDR